MNEVCSFLLRKGDFRREDEASLSSFLKSVNPQRIETAHDSDGWHVLVFYEDMRHKEESAQIEMAIGAALDVWRVRRAEACGKDKLEILPDSLLSDIVHYAPTTGVELPVVAANSNCEPVGDEDGEDIVRVVRQTLEAMPQD
ncbi:MAG: hypothetical protein A2018_03620 [Alphaproteobacteria bacterium GWF2_58_20]|nr:MAG: hypothetical protein A2018_03620 [Alphaproteobacteria bacterium GWF2_58_20]